MRVVRSHCGLSPYTHPAQHSVGSLPILGPVVVGSARALKALDQKLAEMSSKRGKGPATGGGATAPAPEKQEEGGVKGLSGSLSRDVEAP